MDTTTLTVGAVFAVGIILAWPLGFLTRIKFSDNRYTHLDGLRAIAALLVVCCHYLLHARLMTKEAPASHFQEALGAVGVQIFFCITGFLFARKALSGQVDIPALVASRMRRIVPLYLVAMTLGIAVAVTIATSVPTAPAPTLTEVLRIYAYGFIVGPAPTISGMPITGQLGQVWTLAWEWRFYLFVPFLAAALARPAWAFAALVFAIGCLAYQLNGSLPPWAFFLPGIACAVVEPRIRASALARRTLTVVGIVAFGYALWLPEPSYGLAQMALCAVGFPALLFGSRALLSIRPLRLLGEVSFSVYMLHLVVASGLSFYVQSNWEIYKTLDDKLPLAVAALAGMFVLSFIAYALVERPFMAKRSRNPLPSEVRTSIVAGGAELKV